MQGGVQGGYSQTRQLDAADSEEKWRKKGDGKKESARDKYQHEYEKERQRLRAIFDAEDADRRGPSTSQKTDRGCTPHVLRTVSLVSVGVAGLIYKVTGVLQGGLGYIAAAAGARDSHTKTDPTPTTDVD